MIIYIDNSFYVNLQSFRTWAFFHSIKSYRTFLLISFVYSLCRFPYFVYLDLDHVASG